MTKAHEPVRDETVPAPPGAAVHAMLRLPLSAIVIALLLTHADVGVSPLIIMAVVVAYIVTLLLTAHRPATGDAV